MSFNGIEFIDIVLLVCDDKDFCMLLEENGVASAGVCVVLVSAVCDSVKFSHRQTTGGSNHRTDFGKSTVKSVSFSRFASIVFISASISSGNLLTPGTGAGGGL